MFSYNSQNRHDSMQLHVQLIPFFLTTIFLHKFDTKFVKNIKIYIKKINHIFVSYNFFFKKKFFLNNQSQDIL